MTVIKKINSIDKDELQVINKLQNSSNLNIENISKSCGFSKKTTARIIRKLEKNKTILGYHTVIDDKTAGLNRFFLLISKGETPVDRRKLINANLLLTIGFRMRGCS